MFDPKRYRARFLILSLLLVLPVLRMLLHDRYGFGHLEVLAAVLLVCAVAAALAALTPRPAVFHTAFIALVILLSVNAAQIDFMPEVRLRWIIAGLAALMIGALLVLRSQFYPIAAVFLVGTFATDAAKAVMEEISERSSAQAASGGPYRHVVHLVLDGMMGLGGLPSDCGECVRAGARLQEVLERRQFQIYPYAFSNYNTTHDSISSILNNRLLKRTNEYIRSRDPRPYLHENLYFDRYLKDGYAIQVYQSDYFIYGSPEYPSVASVTYKANNLRALHSMRIAWLSRLRQIFVIFLQSDRFWWDTWRRALPAGLHPDRIPAGALASQEIWPETVLRDIRAANRNTLFFAHFMIPHYPYVYASDGSVTDARQWQIQNRVEFYEKESAEYLRRYEMYGRQFRFLARQLDAFLEGLQATGSYDSTTVILHGDHGSRHRMLKESDRLEQAKLQVATPQCPANRRYDYVREPDSRDLLNRFSAMLAIKSPGADSSSVVSERGSLLYFMRRAFGSSGENSEYDALNSVYLFHADGSPQAIPILKFWQRDVEANAKP